MIGYELFQSNKRKFGGSLIYLRKELQPIRNDLDDDFCCVVFRPNKESIMAVVSCYVSPNNVNAPQQLNRINDYTDGLINAYNNIRVIIYGDFNHKIRNQFSGYKKFCPNWTYKSGLRMSITDLFMHASNMNIEKMIGLEDYSNNACYGSSDHRLMGLRVDIPIESSRKRIKLPPKVNRLRQLDCLLVDKVFPAREFFQQMEDVITLEEIEVTYPIPPISTHQK